MLRKVTIASEGITVYVVDTFEQWVFWVLDRHDKQHQVIQPPSLHEIAKKMRSPALLVDLLKAHRGSMYAPSIAERGAWHEVIEAITEVLGNRLDREGSTR